MKHCWRTNESQTNLLTPTLVLFGIMCIADIIKQMGRTDNPITYCFWGLLLCSLVLLFPALAAVLSSRQYKIDANGMTLRYPFGIIRFYGWDEFKEIALCKVHYASASNKHILAIRCALVDEKQGPKHAVVAKERWSKIEYEVLHFGKIITIYYTEDRYAEFKSVCPVPVKDYRHLDDRS